MKRSFPLIAMFVFIFFITLGASICHGIAIYSTFGAGDTYNTGGGSIISGSTSIIHSYYSMAMAFTPSGSFTLDTIELAAFYVAGTNSMNVELLGDSSGLPNSANILDTWNFTNLGYYNPMIFTGTSLSNPLLASGTQYWLAVFPGDPSFFGSWNPSSNSYGTFAQSFDGGATWFANIGSTTKSSAFRISGTPAPLPSTMLLLGSGLVGLVGIGRKRFKK